MTKQKWAEEYMLSGDYRFPQHMNPITATFIAGFDRAIEEMVKAMTGLTFETVEDAEKFEKIIKSLRGK